MDSFNHSVNAVEPALSNRPPDVCISLFESQTNKKTILRDGLFTGGELGIRTLGSIRAPQF